MTSEPNNTVGAIAPATPDSSSEPATWTSHEGVARVLTIASLKGGVGRTTIAINLASMLAATQRKILLIDLDPLGRATASLGLHLADDSSELCCFSKPEDLMTFQTSVPSTPGLHVWRGGAALNKIEAKLWNQPEQKRDLVLEEALQLARRDFDLIIVDSPPNQGPLGRNALACADDILIPVAGNAFDCVTIERTFSLMNSVRQAGAPPVTVHCLRIGKLSDFERSALSNDCQSRVDVFKTIVVSDAETCGNAASNGMILLDYAPHARVTRSLVEACRELITKIFERDSEV